jgi:5-methylcytosine-specific restriction endonuclease McrA
MPGVRIDGKPKKRKYAGPGRPGRLVVCPLCEQRVSHNYYRRRLAKYQQGVVRPPSKPEQCPACYQLPPPKPEVDLAHGAGTRYVVLSRRGIEVVDCPGCVTAWDPGVDKPPPHPVRILCPECGNVLYESPDFAGQKAAAEVRPVASATPEPCEFCGSVPPRRAPKDPAFACPKCRTILTEERFRNLGVWEGWAKHQRPPYWNYLQYLVLSRDKYVCNHCRRKTTPNALIAKHKIHPRDGGTDRLSNLATICLRCDKRGSR